MIFILLAGWLALIIVSMKGAEFVLKKSGKF